VGRGAATSQCILLADHASRPLKAFAATNDGFRIAELDLEERRQGDLLGQRQSGSADIRVARFPEDSDLLGQARDLAGEILEQDPALEGLARRPLRQRALARYPKAEVLFRVG